MKTKNFLIGIAVIVAAFGFSLLERHFRSNQSHPVTAEHTIAPDFSLPDLKGGQLTLSAYRGRVVLLDFWATWCDPCREEIPHFVDLQNKYGSSGLQIIGVSMDDGPEPVRDFYQHFQMNYPVVMGDASVGTLYGGVLGLPIAYLIDRDGRVYAKHIGATSMSTFETEVVRLLQNQSNSGKTGS